MLCKFELNSFPSITGGGPPGIGGPETYHHLVLTWWSSKSFNEKHELSGLSQRVLPNGVAGPHRVE